MQLNDLIGIPYTFKRHDFKRCGCFGIVHLWYKHIKGKNLPWTDGKIRLPGWLRNRKKDPERVVKAYMVYGKKIINDINDLRVGDIMIYKGIRDDAAVGVIVSSDKCLTTNKRLGTYLMTYKKLFRFFYKGIRIDETKI